MSEENMETQPEETTDISTDTTQVTEVTAKNGENTETVETTETPVVDPKAIAREQYKRRQEEKFERENRQRMEEQKQELQTQLDNDDIPPVETVLHEVLQEKEQKIREYELKDFIAENPEYAEHKDAISRAINEPRYANLNHKEVANLVAADSIIQLQAQDRKVGATSAVQGSSARAATNTVDYLSMSPDELNRRAAAAARKPR